MIRSIEILVFSLMLFLGNSSIVLGQKLPDVVVKQYNGKPTVFIDGVPNALPSYSSTINARKPSFEKSMPYFYDHKMGAYFISPAVGKWYDTRFWVGDNISDSVPLIKGKPYDFDLEQMAAEIIKNDPGAYIIIRLFIFPPSEWQTTHRQEYFITEEAAVSNVPSLASDLYWKTSAEFCAALIRYVESQPWANRVIGYANYWINEGTHEPVMLGWMYDHNPLMVQRWQEFLKNRYGTVEKLRAAYGDSTLNFRTMKIPRDPMRGSVSEVMAIPYWQNRRDNVQLRDYLALQQDLFHLRVRQVCGAMENAANRKVLLLQDFLKQTMQGWNLMGFFDQDSSPAVSWNPAYPELMAGSGSMEVYRLFEDAPGISGLITPHDYQARGIGGVYEPEGSVDTAILRGKYFFCEMDTRTYLGSAKKDIAIARDDREFSAIMWRNIAGSLTRGFNSYWMDLTAGNDWFAGENIQKIIGRQVEVMKKSLTWSHETVPGIAMILDDSAVLETNGTGNYLNEAVMWEQKMGMARCGVPHFIYLFEDLLLDNFPKHRVFYFPDLFHVDEKRMSILKEKVFRDGNVVIWGPGSGISDGDKIGTESASRLTGFSFDIIKANSPRRILLTDFEHPITKGLSAATVIGGPLAYGPVILPTDGQALGMAWVKGGFNYTGMAIKEFGKGAAGNGTAGLRGPGDYASVFMTAVNLPAPLWRNLARYAGAHVYSKTDDVLMADNAVVALHSVQSGDKRIALPGKYRIRDLVSDKIIARKTDEIVFTLKAPETRVFLLEK
jgi:hypothetical protein